MSQGGLGTDAARCWESRQSSPGSLGLRAALVEAEHHLLDGRDRGDIDPNACDRLSDLARAATRATTHVLPAQRRRAQAAR